MDLYSRKSKSIPQKMVLLALGVATLAASYWVLFLGGYAFIFPDSPGIMVNEKRHVILFAFNMVLFSRLLVTVFYLIKRRIPWEEAFSVPFAFAAYYIGFALLGYETYSGIDLLDYCGIFLFVIGSCINTGSEIKRDIWKKDPANKGKLYTGGLFHYAMHINYFGDLLWVSGYALVSHNGYAVLFPVGLFCFFAFFNAPKLDKYLLEKYGEQFLIYSKKTKKIIPFIY